MFKIMKYLKESKAAVFAVIVLLVLQAACDLALPQYTSNIVDVGIQQNGIEYAVPQRMRAETWEGLQFLLPDSALELFLESYEGDAEGSYCLSKEGKKHQEELEEYLAMPLVFLYSLEHPADGQTEDGSQLKAALEMGMISKEELLASLEEAKSSMGEMGESMLAQRAVLAVQGEYEALGIDLHDIQMKYLWISGAKMLGISIVITLTAIFVGLLSARTGAKIGRNLRERVFHKVVSFSGAELDRFSTASLITRSTNDIQQVQMVAVMLLRMVIYSPILGIGGVIKVSNTRTGMGWVIGVAVGAILLLVGVLMSIAMPKFKKMQQLVDRLNLVAREILTGVSVIRAFSRERHEEKRFDVANRDLMKTQLFTNRVMNFMMPMMMLVMNGITVLIVWVGAKGIDMGSLQVGDMMAFITYTMQIVMSFLMLTMISVMLPRAGVAAGRIEEILETESMIQDKEQSPNGQNLPAEWKGEVTFDHVSFRYPGAEGNALENLSFTARPGETTAVIGSTGCGKSTLIHLIPRFYDVTEGAIRLDGVDIRDIPQAILRKQLGFVPQKGVLFSGDIRSNLKFGGADISEEEMEEAARIAQAKEFIEEKPEGYASHISQGGTNVSGGQKQRLSIARAIAKKPKVFLFDDSFSALDYKTDVVLRKALKEKTADAAVMIVAQRISTILHADQIIVLEEGRIAGIGTHEELLASCEAYQEIAKSQLSEAELGGVGA